MNETTTPERLTQFIALYKQYYAVELSLEQGEEILHVLLGLLRAVQEGINSFPEDAPLGRYNNTAPVVTTKTKKNRDQ